MVTILLCIVAISLCIVMSVHSINGNTVAGCTTDAGCSDILTSVWSKLFNVIPVSGLATGVWLALLTCTSYRIRFHDGDKESETVAGLLSLVVAGMITGSALWFTSLQLFILHDFCRYCMSVHIIGIIASAITLTITLVRHKWKAFAIGVAIAAAIPIIQLTGPWNRISANGTIKSALPEVAAEDVPIVGNHNAPKVITLLYDYQCSHCMKIHSMLEETVSRSNGEIAFLLCPTPLSPECNHYIPPTGDDPFKGSCELAVMSLAIWYAAPDLFFEFDRWLFSEQTDGSWQPRTPEEAESYAEELLSARGVALQDAVANPRISKAIRLHTEILGRTSSGGNGGIPRLIYGRKWLTPDAVDSEELKDEIYNTFLQ